MLFSNLRRLFSNRAPIPADPATTPADEPVVSNPSAKLSAQIQHLIALGKTGEALALLADAGYADAALLKKQLDVAQAEYDQQRIKFQEWSQIQARINYATLSLFQKEKEAQAPTAVPVDPILDIPVSEQQRKVIRDLVYENRTQEALNLAEGLGINFRMTKTRFMQGKKHWNLGLIDEEAWAGIQKQINEALLFFLEQHPGL